MIVLSFDPGATRCGWAVTGVSDGGAISYFDSGVVSFPRPVDGRGALENYQTYRERLLKHWVDVFPDIAEVLLEARSATGDLSELVAFEIVPAIGFKSGGAVQSQLAQCVVTVCQTICETWGWSWAQVSATAVKKSVTGYGDATKVQVRDAVLSVFPELEPRKKELTVVADEADAIAIGLAACGYKVPKAKNNPRRRKSKSNSK